MLLGADITIIDLCTKLLGAFIGKEKTEDLILDSVQFRPFKHLLIGTTSIFYVSPNCKYKGFSIPCNRHKIVAMKRPFDTKIVK